MPHPFPARRFSDLLDDRRGNQIVNLLSDRYRFPKMLSDRLIQILHETGHARAGDGFPGFFNADYLAHASKLSHLADKQLHDDQGDRSEEHTSELQSLMRISYAVFCLKTKNT